MPQTLREMPGSGISGIVARQQKKQIMTTNKKAFPGIPERLF
jgi:hypothetical protein